MTDQVLAKVLSQANPFTDKTISPLILIELLNKKFGPDWVLWLLDTIKERIEAEYPVVVDPIVMHKIGAIKSILNSLAYFETWSAFEKVCVVFNERRPDFSLMQLLSLPEVFYTVNVVKKIRALDLRDEPKAYIKTLCDYYGVKYMPPPLDFINDNSPESIEQGNLVKAWTEKEEYSPKIYEQVSAIVYDKLKRLLAIKQEREYLS